MKQGKHLSMIRSFHLADWFTLGNAACGVGALFAVMSYLQSQDMQHLLFACALILFSFVACGVSRLARYNITAETLSQGSDKVRYFEGTPIPSSLLLVIVIVMAAVNG